MKITIDLEEGLAKQIVRWTRAMDRKAYEFTGILLWEGVEDKTLLKLAVQSLVKEGMAGKIAQHVKVCTNDGESGTCGKE